MDWTFRWTGYDPGLVDNLVDLRLGHESTRNTDIDVPGLRSRWYPGGEGRLKEVSTMRKTVVVVNRCDGTNGKP